MAQTVATPTVPATIAPPPAGTAPLPAPSPVAATGKTFEVNVTTSQLRVRSVPRIDPMNVLGHLPDGHRVRLVSTTPRGKFLEIETSLNGARLHGFAATEFLVPVADDALVPVVTPAAANPTSGIIEAHVPRKAGSITKRTAPATAMSLNEPNQPSRSGTTPEQLRGELRAIVDYLAVDKPTHLRYQPRGGATFCNIYAHDYCSLAGVYLPRVWWTPDAIERLARGERVEPRIGGTIDEQRANDLFRWLRAFGTRFGWRQTGTLTSLQLAANSGAVCLIIARRKLEGRSGHVTVVAAENELGRAKRDSTGEVSAPFQSQAGARNFRFGTGASTWWLGDQFADSAFWIHA
jgi:hypothetical protein